MADTINIRADLARHVLPSRIGAVRDRLAAEATIRTISDLPFRLGHRTPAIAQAQDVLDAAAGALYQEAVEAEAREFAAVPEAVRSEVLDAIWRAELDALRLSALTDQEREILASAALVRSGK